MIELCLRCGQDIACRADWLHCEPCWQAVCDEIHAGLAWLDDPDNEVLAAHVGQRPGLPPR